MNCQIEEGNRVRARITDFFDYVLAYKTERENDEVEDEKFKDLQEKYRQLNKKYEQVQRELEIVTLSRDRYLATCKKRSTEKKTLKKKLDETNKELKELKEQKLGATL